jgi:hypothetical protein
MKIRNIPLEVEDFALYLYEPEFFFTPRLFAPNLIEIGLLAVEKIFKYFIFSYFAIISPWKGVFSFI